MEISRDIICRGEKVSLRFLSVSDVGPVYLSWLDDPEVMQGIATGGYTLEKLTTYVKERTAQRMTAFFAILWNDSNEHIGNVKLDFHDEAANLSELGLLIGNKNYWGKGVGYEACYLAMHYGFEVQKLNRIWLAVYENNLNAKKLYERLGFKVEARLRKHVFAGGTVQDKFLMGILKEEFK